MFLVLDQVYYGLFQCNTQNNYNWIIKTKWNNSLEIIYNRKKKHQAS